MKRRRAAVVLAGVAAACGFAWYWADPLGAHAPLTFDAPAGGWPLAGRSRELAAVRLRMDAPALDAFLAEQRARAEAGGAAEAWRVLAEAHLERALLEASHKGMAVGEPTFGDVPGAMAAHLEQAEAAALRAEQIGGEHSETQRIRAGVLSTRITGALSAMRLGRTIERLLARARELDGDNPHVAVAQGCKLVFAPGWLGGDPKAALSLFLAAAEGLPHDERPLVFAAFAANVCGDPRVESLLARAVERNPNNRYAAEVLRRVRAGERDAFARDVTKS